MMWLNQKNQPRLDVHQDVPLPIFQDPDSSSKRFSWLLQFSEVKKEVILNYQQFWKWLRLTAWSRAIMKEKRCWQLEKPFLREWGGAGMMEGVNSLRKIICIAAHFILLFLVELSVLTSLGRYWLCFFDRTKSLCCPSKTIATHPDTQGLGRGRWTWRSCLCSFLHKQHQ